MNRLRVVYRTLHYGDEAISGRRSTCTMLPVERCAMMAVRSLREELTN
jgi:hypothetical protein